MTTFILELKTDDGRWVPAMHGSTIRYGAHNQQAWTNLQASTFPSMAEAEDAWLALRRDCQETRKMRIREEES